MDAIQARLEPSSGEAQNPHTQTTQAKSVEAKVKATQNQGVIEVGSSKLNL
jgi:hypothetical protein